MAVSSKKKKRRKKQKNIKSKNKSNKIDKNKTTNKKKAVQSFEHKNTGGKKKQTGVNSKNIHYNNDKKIEKEISNQTDMIVQEMDVSDVDKGDNLSTDTLIDKDNIIDEVTLDRPKDMLSQDVLKENNDTVSCEKVNYSNNLSKLIIIFIILGIIILGLIMCPRIKLVGGKDITLNYKEEFTEPGYYANKMGKDITNKIMVSGKVINHKIGKYELTYQIKYLFFTIKKKRYVNIVDNIKPVINVLEDIKLCPNEDIKKVKFEAIDEYDGILTDNVLLDEQGGKLRLWVKDSSMNEEIVWVNLTREDKEKPQIVLTGGEVMYLNYGTQYVEPGYSASDNCDGDLTDRVVVTGKVENAVGTYHLTYKVEDSSMNETTITRTVIVRRNNLSNNLPNESGTIYLTFDDGPNEDTTNYILDILKEENIKATFFVTCNGPDYLIKRMYDEGHTIALHSATHDYSYIYSSVDNYFMDLGRVSNRVKQITGFESKIIRFPGGSSNTVSKRYKLGIMSELTNLVIEKGYRYYDWNVDADDAGRAYTSFEVYNNVISGISPNRMNMVLMHDSKYQTKDALRDIIHYGKENGYLFRQIDDSTYMIRHGVNN